MPNVENLANTGTSGAISLEGEPTTAILLCSIIPNDILIFVIIVTNKDSSHPSSNTYFWFMYPMKISHMFWSYPHFSSSCLVILHPFFSSFQTSYLLFFVVLYKQLCWVLPKFMSIYQNNSGNFSLRAYDLKFVWPDLHSQEWVLPYEKRLFMQSWSNWLFPWQ